MEGIECYFRKVEKEATEEILEARGNETGRVVPPRRAVNPRRSIPR